jgi:hypothetical protein
MFYWCATWLVTLTEERKPRVVENRVLRKIFSPKREEITGGWRKLCVLFMIPTPLQI